MCFVSFLKYVVPGEIIFLSSSRRWWRREKSLKKILNMFFIGSHSYKIRLMFQRMKSCFSSHDMPPQADTRLPNTTNEAVFRDCKSKPPSNHFCHHRQGIMQEKQGQDPLLPASYPCCVFFVTNTPITPPS